MVRRILDVSSGQIQELPDLPPEPTVVIVPKQVTMRQARLALHQAGLLPTVEAAINALPEPPRTAARIEWDYSNAIQRNNPFVSQLALMLGFTESQLDELFILAASI
jgi:hypothetical protein